MKRTDNPGSAASGYILLNKKPGITSFQALDEIKKTFPSCKVGHTGTLDKFASGLLLVLAGRAVKLSPWFSGCDKEYDGTIRFGTETATLDPEGAVVAEAPPPDMESLQAVLPGFRGNILQRPPAYSALHIHGKRAYALARSGTPVEMPERPAVVYALELLSFEPPLARIRVRCSKGTYIRSLARDIALAAGSRGHLMALTRTCAAGFRLSQAVDSPVRSDLHPLRPETFAALGIFRVEAEDGAVRDILCGRPPAPLFESGALRFFPGEDACSLSLLDDFGREPRISRDQNSSPACAGVFDKDGNLLAVIERTEGGRWVYGCVYA
ncbi:MAG: tRNA pseudouridine(55) synthase TruB [Treponema sp.]|jgi:tRNA pseudouridine55 synthase|nr:tRNA pseudouridine(55) synthase TruB [Treponema sp.]